MSAKLHEAFCLDSARELFFWRDDFIGDQLRDEWGTAISAGSSVAIVDGVTGGTVRLTTGSVAEDYAYIYWNTIRSLLVSKNTSVEVLLSVDSTTNGRIWVFLWTSGSNQITLFQSDGVGQMWCTRTLSGGVTTQNNSNLNNNTSPHRLRINCHTHGVNHVHFLVDGIELNVSPHTTNIPTTYLEPLISRETRGAGGVRTADVDYVAVRHDR